MWPQVPENISQITDAEQAKSFARAIRTRAAEVLRSGTDDEKAEVADQLAIRDALMARVAELAQADALADDEADAPVEPTADASTEAADDSADSEEEDEAAADETLATQPAAKPGKKLSTTFGAAGAAGTVTVAPARTAPEYLLRTSGSGGKAPGTPFASWGEMAEEATRIGRSIAPTSTEKFEIARIRGDYDAAHTLSDDTFRNLLKFEAAADAELTAAFCPPATPHYNIACANVLRRPVFNSLPGFAAPRGTVSIMPSPALSDITGGYGQWTSEDDANADALKEECQTITCGTPTDYEMYGVYKCLTVKNMMWMTYPELVEAYLNRLGAATARYAEQLMLNAMATSATSVNGRQLGYGGSVTITSTILNYLALYQETQRWDITSNMKAWLPRWVLWAMKMDMMRRRNLNGQLVVPSDAQIERMFSDVGVDVTWFIDTPTWAVAIPGIGATLNLLPATVEILIAPPGKFAAIDRGELAIGVTGNNIYRDNTSNRKNEFTYFMENFEGVVSTTSCPAHVLSIPACWNGVQIDDIVINCQGGDEVGYQS